MWEIFHISTLPTEEIKSHYMWNLYYILKNNIVTCKRTHKTQKQNTHLVEGTFTANRELWNSKKYKVTFSLEKVSSLASVLAYTSWCDVWGHFTREKGFVFRAKKLRWTEFNSVQHGTIFSWNTNIFFIEPTRMKLMHK